MNRIRIIAGSLKGRVIPFSNEKFDDADITPQKVKKALFSIIGETLDGEGFLDLFACSGQIGIEALSRGADPVVLNEQERKRFQFIKSCINDLNPVKAPILLNLPYQQALDCLRDHDITFHYIFLDPPYQNKGGGGRQYREIMRMIGSCGLLHSTGKIIIQHFSSDILDEESGTYHLSAIKKYGTTSLSVYNC